MKASERERERERERENEKGGAIEGAKSREEECNVRDGDRDTRKRVDNARDTRARGRKEKVETIPGTTTPRTRDRGRNDFALRVSFRGKVGGFNSVDTRESSIGDFETSRGMKNVAGRERTGRERKVGGKKGCACTCNV